MKKSPILCAALYVVIITIIFSCKRLDVPVATGSCLQITRTSTAATESQTVAVNTPIVPITYTVSASLPTDTTAADTAHISFSGSLPPGVTSAVVNGVFTISGTPTTNTGSPFTYTVTATGASCNTTPITGTITVSPAGTTAPIITGATTGLAVGNTMALTGSGTPAISNPWVSSNTSIATVSNVGLVTGIANGTVLITYTNSNNISTTQVITVNNLPTISGIPSVCVGTSVTWVGSGIPAAANPWVSGTPGVATVDNNGVVNGVAAGTTQIVYKDNNGNTAVQIETVNAIPGITGVLNTSVGLTTTLTASGTPAAIDPWISYTPYFATISNAGVVTGINAGTTLIIYTNNNGCTVAATVTVSP